MAKTYVVLGLAFGDEGKGITTDFLCSQHPKDDTMVIRFSGGQQAGHNVVIGDKSHIHATFGSGALRGYPTYITEDCSFYLPAYMEEKDTLAHKGSYPELYLHPMAHLTTPMDVAWNRVFGKHGTTGMGVGATMHRNLNTGYKLIAHDLKFPDILRKKLEGIYYYYNLQLHELGLTDTSSPDRVLYNEKLSEELVKWDLALARMKDRPILAEKDILKKFRTNICEGSQGILLDMDHGFFPNVTYSRTTSRQINQLANVLRHGGMPHIYYVTRCYKTRHGEGYWGDETPITLVNNGGETNVHNEFQGNFQVAELDYDLLNYALSVDNLYSDTMKKTLVVTCLDQRPSFQFDESRLNTLFDGIIHSFGPDNKDFIQLVEHGKIVLPSRSSLA